MAPTLGTLGALLLERRSPWPLEAPGNEQTGSELLVVGPGPQLAVRPKEGIEQLGLGRQAPARVDEPTLGELDPLPLLILTQRSRHVA